MSIDVARQDSVDFANLRAFDSSDILIDEVIDHQILSFMGETISVSSASSNIAYVLAFGSGANDAIHLDRLTYNQTVNALATAALLAVGLAALRRRRKAPVD